MKITSRMIGHQARLGVRTLRHLRHHPSDGKDFGRLLRAGARGTTTLRLPWLPFSLIDDLASRLDAGSTVFEYGGGGSTLWFRDRDCSVVTVEHSREWADELRRKIAESARWTLLAPGAGLPEGEDHLDSYVEAIDGFADDSFDVIVVDGRQRVRCFQRALSKVKPGGVILLDDSDRPHYADALCLVDWPRHQVIGFAPAKPTLAYTTVFERPQ